MKQTFAVVFMGLVLMHGGAAVAQVSKADVMMQVRVNFAPSTIGCNVFSFVAAPPPAQPELGATLCAIGGPFGAGMVGIVEGPFPSFAGLTIHILDRIVSFSSTDAIYLRILFRDEAGIDTGTGGVVYHVGGWKITGGTGAFSGLSGAGSTVSSVVSNFNVPPPPEYVVEELVGRVTW